LAEFFASLFAARFAFFAHSFELIALFGREQGEDVFAHPLAVDTNFGAQLSRALLLFGREGRARLPQLHELAQFLSPGFETLPVARFDLAQLPALRVGQIQTLQRTPFHPLTATAAAAALAVPSSAAHPAFPAHAAFEATTTFPARAVLRRGRLRERGGTENCDETGSETETCKNILHPFNSLNSTLIFTVA